MSWRTEIKVSQRFLIKWFFYLVAFSLFCVPVFFPTNPEISPKDAKLSRRTILFLALSGLATGVSWLAYFRALQLAPVSSVAPIDKLSLAFTVVLAALVLSETVSLRLVAGVVLMMAGALLTRG